MLHLAGFREKTEQLPQHYGPLSAASVLSGDFPYPHGSLTTNSTGLPHRSPTVWYVTCLPRAMRTRTPLVRPSLRSQPRCPLRSLTCIPAVSEPYNRPLLDFSAAISTLLLEKNTKLRWHLETDYRLKGKMQRRVRIGIRRLHEPHTEDNNAVTES